LLSWFIIYFLGFLEFCAKEWRGFGCEIPRPDLIKLILLVMLQRRRSPLRRSPPGGGDGAKPVCYETSRRSDTCEAAGDVRVVGSSQIMMPGGEAGTAAAGGRAGEGWEPGILLPISGARHHHRPEEESFSPVLLLIPIPTCSAQLSFPARQLRRGRKGGKKKKPRSSAR
jgi:hypothetical protein